ncbi:hypothetical protein ACFR9U_00395 [Halorientalis brevis]|uniref:DUF8009 domain-containing protein n=1 Tax=Halorientalis brevis TaxID=1126241 RepID=A0ABD6C6S8_9EURY|nr:hypothetical protein [Halorientalis brevis]
MGTESDDPSVIRSIAISTEDLVAALESAQRSGRDAVLRVTPPFSGRMRARLHVEGDDQYDDPSPIHVDPTTLVAESAPDYPTPAQTEDEIRADPTETYSRERHHERHATAVGEWRANLGSHVVETTTIDTQSGSHEIEVTLLG